MTVMATLADSGTRPLSWFTRKLERFFNAAGNHRITEVQCNAILENTSPEGVDGTLKRPDAPIGANATANAAPGTLTVSINSDQFPAFDGGTPVTHVRIQYADTADTITAWTELRAIRGTGAGFVQSIGPVSPGTEQTIRVALENSVGVGAYVSITGTPN